ncbi:hypothetical protein MAQ5080_03259 [Marinomonas aquimarina]|uniref:Uncharacterized protein n=1 Tax=Marinomonas aquimarina TaxID=295068 RepID=A0A1A8TS00_9GAMM|nr:hypothetical protein [Marinomonas aquimarina]SBS35744.1 hypothetical protein MAQ5080_03259 [Marinomonas aquimarina]
MLTLELLDKHISECREYVEAGKEDLKTLEFLLSLRHDLEQATPEDWAAYNELADHLPDQDADPVLIQGSSILCSLFNQTIIEHDNHRSK